jgi:hypothetical protein
MKRIIIICEGNTEIEFCNEILYPHFLPQDIFLETPLIKKTKGGIVPWPTLKRQIKKHLLQDPTAFVTTFIDFYGIPDDYLFPDWEQSKTRVDKNERMALLEKAMKKDIDDSIAVRFEPYLQLHELEGLLFNNIDAFDRLIPVADFVDREELIQIIESYPNCELINDTPDNAPSYRLERLIRGYNKIVDGPKLAKQIGLDNIRRKSPRFSAWIEKLERLGSTK